MAPKDQGKRLCSVYLTEEAIAIIDDISKSLGISRSSAIEIIIRKAKPKGDKAQSSSG